MQKVYISLGSNLGDRQRYIEKALEMLGSMVKKVSPVIETEPVDMESGSPNFLNAVAEIETSLTPEGLLNFLEDMENKLGRTEKGRYKPRTIDIDILYYADLELDTPRLKIPHPGLRKREFLCRLLKTLEIKKEKKK